MIQQVELENESNNKIIDKKSKLDIIIEHKNKYFRGFIPYFYMITICVGLISLILGFVLLNTKSKFCYCENLNNYIAVSNETCDFYDIPNKIVYVVCQDQTENICIQNIIVNINNINFTVTNDDCNPSFTPNTYIITDKKIRDENLGFGLFLIITSMTLYFCQTGYILYSIIKELTS